MFQKIWGKKAKATTKVTLRDTKESTIELIGRLELETTMYSESYLSVQVIPSAC